MKTPEEMAEEYTRYWWPDYNDVKTCCQTHLATRQAFLAGYKAAKAIVEEELQAVQAQRAEYPGLGAAQYALKSVLAKMGSK